MALGSTCRGENAMKTCQVHLQVPPVRSYLDVLKTTYEVDSLTNFALDISSAEQVSPQVPTMPQSHKSVGIASHKVLNLGGRQPKHFPQQKKTKQPNQDNLIHTTTLLLLPLLRSTSGLEQCQKVLRTPHSFSFCDIMMNTASSCFMVTTSRQYFMSPTFTKGLISAEIHRGCAEKPVPTMLAR